MGDRTGEEMGIMSRHRPNSARVKIQSPTYELAEKILEALEEKFNCVTGPIIPSERGGYHTFLNVTEEGVVK